MLVGVLFAGIASALIASATMVTLGAPFWLCLLAYPVMGMAGTLCFAGLSYTLHRDDMRPSMAVDQRGARWYAASASFPLPIISD